MKKYLVYETQYSPFWLKNENKPEKNFFNSINFNWKLIPINPNFISEVEVNFMVNDLNKIYYKIESYDENNTLIETLYFGYESVKKRFTEGFLINLRLDIWATYNMELLNNLQQTDAIIKFDRATISVSNFKPFPIYNEQLISSSWKKINNPNIDVSWTQLNLFDNNKSYYQFYDENGNFKSNKQLKECKLVYKGNDFNQTNKIVNKYLVAYLNNEYLLFPDFTFNFDNSIRENNTNAIVSNSINVDNNQLASLFHIEGKIYNDSGNLENIQFKKINRLDDLNTIIGKSKIWGAKTDIFWFYGPDIKTLIEKFKLDFFIINENNHYFTFCLRLNYYGKVANNVFNNVIEGSKLISKDLNSDTFFTNAEKQILIGNTKLKLKELINNDYLLFFNQAGFKLIPTNQTNKELLKIIDYGDLLPTNKDQYLQYVNSVRNSVNTGYWTNRESNEFDLGIKGAKGLIESFKNPTKAFSNAFSIVSGGANLIFKDSLTIKRMEAKYKDINNSLSAAPETSNLNDLANYLIPFNWSITTGKNISGVIPYYFSVYDWLEPVKIDLNNIFLYYGFELNNYYPLNQVNNQGNCYYLQINEEWISNNLYQLYFNKDTSIIRLCCEQFINGVRVWKKEFNNNNFIVDFR